MKSVFALGLRQYSLQKVGKFLKIQLPTHHQLKDSIYENVAIREPYTILQQWLEIAERTSPQSKVRLACLATVDATGQPVMRLINIEQINASGITFYTALGGRQAGNISCNPHVSLLLQWPHQERSVHLSGMVTPVCAIQAQRRFNRYPHGTKLSLHGRHLPRRKTHKWFFMGTICERLGDVFAKYSGKQLQNVPMPYNWGGYLLKPHLYEFIDAGKGDTREQCMRFRRCLTLPRGKRSETVTADCYDWVFDKCSNMAN